MPRNVRNFWLELSVDGKASRVATGPRARDGGFQLTVKQRDNGGVAITGELVGHVRANGTLALTWEPAKGEPVSLNETVR